MTTVSTPATTVSTPTTPVGRLTVLYDADCPLCVHLRHWLMRRRQLVPLDLVPAGSQRARQLFPDLDHAATLREITVVGDRGQVYRASAAWIVCLWALAGHRATAHRLATPAGQPFARAAVLAAAKWREALRDPEGSGCEDGRCDVPGPPG
ncbi:thiol-disulfide oxidoreductase DCC family protein [Streptomyces sp. NPDC085529]|uniref:thiol-disulfide oxidoreductase DCC family protein n=1 Tax=Streptomyces sp. NPDC085529 TaxID=3365729 RepID=UPI0037D78519